MRANSRTGRVLRGLVRLSCRRPGLTIAVSLLAAVAGGGYTLSHLGFKTSGRDLLPQKAGYVARYAELRQRFGRLEDIVVAIEARSFEAASAYAARLVEELRASPIEFPRAVYRVDPEGFEGRKMLYLSKAKLEEIRDAVMDHQEFMEQFAGDPGLATLIEGVNNQIAAAFLTNLFDLGLKDGAMGDTRFLRTLLELIDGRLSRPGPYRSPWGSLFSFGEDPPADTGYFLSPDKKLLFVLVEAPPGARGSFVKDRRAIAAVRSAIERVRTEFPTVEAGVTGAPVLSNDEMTTAFDDSQIATTLAFVLTLLVMLLAFQRVLRPVLMLIVLAVSLAWSLGIVTLTVGHLTIFSVMFISIVIGIGIDYGIYLLFRYEEERFLGRSLSEALELTAARTGPGMLLGALTAAGAFYVLMLTDFRGIQELGFIAGTAILLAWLSMMTLYPALLVVVDRRRPAGVPDGPAPEAAALERLHVPAIERLTRHSTTVLVIAGLVTGASLWALPHVAFDYNLLHLQAKGTESVEWEKRILTTTGRSGFSALTSADSLTELRRKQEAFDRLPSVSRVDSVWRLIPESQEEKIAVLRSIEPIVSPVRVGRSRPVDLARLDEALRGLIRRLDVAVKEGGDKLPAEIPALAKQAQALLAKLGRTSTRVAEPALTHLQSQLYRDFVEKFHDLQHNVDPRPVTARDVPAELRRRYVSEDGHFLIQIHPAVDIWEKAGAEQFVRELRSVDPDVTGMGVISYEATGHMDRAYLQGTIYAFVLVGAVSFAMIRRWRETLLALLPLGLALVWTIGLMRVFGLEFNLANIWGLPLVIGASAEFGLNVVVRYLEGREHGGPLVARSTLMAVALNGVTTMVGFGSMLVARHQGIHGLGLFLTLGSACGLLASLVVLPALLGRLSRQAAKADQAVGSSAA
jgi:hypothetical protein